MSETDWCHLSMVTWLHVCVIWTPTSSQCISQPSLSYPTPSSLLNNWWNKVYWLWAHVFTGGLAQRSRVFDSFNYSSKWCNSKQEMLLFNTCYRSPWQDSLLHSDDSDISRRIHPHSTLCCLHATTLTALYCCLSLSMPVTVKHCQFILVFSYPILIVTVWHWAGKHLWQFHSI